MQGFNESLDPNLIRAAVGKWGVLETSEWIKRLKPENCSKWVCFTQILQSWAVLTESCTQGIPLQWDNLICCNSSLILLWEAQSAFICDRCLMIELILWIISSTVALWGIKRLMWKLLLRQLGAGQECLGGKRNVPALGLFMQNWEKSLKQCCSTFCCCFFVGFGVFQCCPAAPWRGKMPSSGLQGNSQAGFHLCSSWIQLWSDENPQPKKKKNPFCSLIVLNHPLRVLDKCRRSWGSSGKVSGAPQSWDLRAGEGTGLRIWGILLVCGKGGAGSGREFVIYPSPDRGD